MATSQPDKEIAPGVVTTSLRRTLFIAIAVKLVLLAGLGYTLRAQRATLSPPAQSLASILTPAPGKAHTSAEALQ